MGNTVLAFDTLQYAKRLEELEKKIKRIEERITYSATDEEKSIIGVGERLSNKVDEWVV